MAKRQRTAETLPVDAIDLPRGGCGETLSWEEEEEEEEEWHRATSLVVDTELEVLGYSRKYHEAVTKVLAKVQEGEEEEDEGEDIIIPASKPASKPPYVKDAKDAGMVRSTPPRGAGD